MVERTFRKRLVRSLPPRGEEGNTRPRVEGTTDDDAHRGWCMVVTGGVRSGVPDLLSRPRVRRHVRDLSRVTEVSYVRRVHGN